MICRRLILIITFFSVPFFSQTIAAQAVVIDSLRQLINNAKEDSNKVLLLLKLGQQYEPGNPDTAVLLYKQAGSLSNKINFPFGIIKYLNSYPGVLNQQGKFDESLQLSWQALHLAEKYKIWRSYYGSAFNIGNIYIYKGDNQSA